MTMAGDAFDLPKIRLGNVHWLIGSQPIAGNGWRTFQVPDNASMLYLLCVGSGASGGGGQSSANGVAATGGGGGGAGAWTKMIIPAIALPRQLFLFAAIGGLAVGANTGGNAGGRSFICDKPSSTNTEDYILTSSGQTGGAAGGSAGSVGGGGGTADPAAVQVNAPYTGFGVWTTIAGQTGASGGATGGAGNPVVWGNQGILSSAGAGGGSCNTTTTTGAGGAITGALGLVPTIPGGAAGGGAGAPGFNQGFAPASGFTQGLAGIIAQLWATSGGSGGGGKNGGTAGAGGAGGIGSGGGGGGGGGGTGGGTGGGGGPGGPGLVLITWW